MGAEILTPTGFAGEESPEEYLELHESPELSGGEGGRGVILGFVDSR
jgi:hypothetical protein